MTLNNTIGRIAEVGIAATLVATVALVAPGKAQAYTQPVPDCVEMVNPLMGACMHNNQVFMNAATQCAQAPYGNFKCEAWTKAGFRHYIGD